MAIDYVKKRTRYSDDGLAVFDLDNCDRDEISLFVEDDLDEVDCFRELYDRISRTIHTLPSLFDPSQKIELDHLKIYVGRSNNVGKRLEDHWFDSRKNLPYGVPIAWLSSKNAPVYERCGIHFLKYLRNKNSLCVGSLENVKTNGGGENGPSIIYLSFGLDKRLKMHGCLSKDLLSLAVGKIHGDLDERGYDLDPELIESCLQSSSDPSKQFKLYWHNSSKLNKKAS